MCALDFVVRTFLLLLSLCFLAFQNTNMLIYVFLLSHLLSCNFCLLLFSFSPVSIMALVIILLLIWQQGNVSNQREHIVHLLANEQTRLRIPEEPEPVVFILSFTFK